MASVRLLALLSSEFICVDSFVKKNLLIAVCFYTVMCFTCEYACSSTPSIIYAVAGIKNTNLNIRCYDLVSGPKL